MRVYKITSRRLGKTDIRNDVQEKIQKQTYEDDHKVEVWFYTNNDDDTYIVMNHRITYWMLPDHYEASELSLEQLKNIPNIQTTFQNRDYEPF